MQRLYSATALTVIFYLFCSPAGAAESQPVGHLSMSKGRFHRAGKDYRGIGINSFDLFRRLFETGPVSATRRSPREGLAILAEKEIPFVRFAACGFYPVELRRYVDDPESYFALLDGVVAEAEISPPQVRPPVPSTAFTPKANSRQQPHYKPRTPTLRINHDTHLTKDPLLSKFLGTNPIPPEWMQHRKGAAKKKKPQPPGIHRGV
jgi:hypothetical protein